MLKGPNRREVIRSFLGAAGLSALQSPAAAATPTPTHTSILSTGLGSLPLLESWATRSVSPENPTGEKGRGARAIPGANDPDLPFAGLAKDLGQGWKVNPFLKPKAGQTVTIMDVKGPGVIQHIWMSTETNWAGNGRACVLRFYWDDESSPSVEVPLTDFFAVGHDLFAPVRSLAVVVNPTSALNAYWPMPFRKRAKITFTNESDNDLSLFTYQITYALAPVPQKAGYFHAQWRRSVTRRTNPAHTILDSVKGKGRYVGTFLAWTQLSEGWFGEGEIKFFLDGDRDFPTICGTGTEDYFGASYGFPASFTGPYSGSTLRIDSKSLPYKWSLYRWHIMDPINFKRDLRVSIQALGSPDGGRYRALTDDIASLAYWYQREPHAPFPAFPKLDNRWPR
jgi:Protein of unknown function (DUF2961)